MSLAVPQAVRGKLYKGRERAKQHRRSQPSANLEESLSDFCVFLTKLQVLKCKLNRIIEIMNKPSYFKVNYLKNIH